MTLGEKIYFYRKRCAFSQEELAEQVGVSRQAVSKWELGDAMPEVDKLLTLAKTFGVTTDELLNSDSPTDGAKCDTSSPETSPPDHCPDLSVIGRFAKKYGFLLGYAVAIFGLVLLYEGLIMAVVGGQLLSLSEQITSATINGEEINLSTVGFHSDLLDWDSMDGKTSAETVSTVAGILQTVGTLQLIASVVLVIVGLATGKHLRERKGRHSTE